MEDCFLALEWMVGQSAPLGLDPARLAVDGGSAPEMDVDVKGVIEI